MEVWKVIPSVPDYEASSEGRIRNVKTGRIMKVRKNSKGYLQLNLRESKNVQKKYEVHRLVCEAFHGPKPFDGAVVRHSFRNRTLNKPEVLKWGTQRDNCLDQKTDTFIEIAGMYAGLVM